MKLAPWRDVATVHGNYAVVGEALDIEAQTFVECGSEMSHSSDEVHFVPAWGSLGASGSPFALRAISSRTLDPEVIRRGRSLHR